MSTMNIIGIVISIFFVIAYLVVQIKLLKPLEEQVEQLENRLERVENKVVIFESKVNKS